MIQRTLIALTILTLGISSVQTSNADALSGGDFQAGRITDDSVFFNGNTMPSHEVQAFLDSKVPVCDTNGTKPRGNTTRASYGAANGNPAPYICLKNYSQNTPSRPAEQGLCNAYGGGQKTAAQIISEVGQACGINPKALIVLLEKEQSLITDDWPWTIQYSSATGFGCPDTAPCDPQFGAFFDQIYYGARQFKRYARDANLFRYRANRDNFIQYHPNAACGGTNVFLQNQATAGLYNYTPYQPNATALSNIYGGQNDGCSSYGNRNFWRIFNDWFGGGYGPGYSAQIMGLEAYTNPERTRSFTNITTLQPGSTVYLRAKVRNNGYLPWNQAWLNIGTESPRDRSSPFANNSWLNAARPGHLTQTTLAPSETGTFDFTITAPSYTGTYRENFGLVVEGNSWVHNSQFSYQINVVSASTPPNPAATILNSGAELKPNKYMLSPDSQANLFLQTDGNLVLYSDFQPVWNTLTSRKSPKHLLMQTDGNLVLYSTDNQALWASGTNGNPGAYLALQYDGNLVIYSQQGAPLWTSNTVHTPAYNDYVNTSLHTSSLYPGQQIQTADRNYRFVLQHDGNLVLYSPFRPVWATGTDGKSVARLTMQTDGNLVLYDVNGQPVWHSRTNGQGISALVAQPDGNIVMYNGTGRPTWNTQTAGQQ